MIQLRVELENEFVYLDLYELDPPTLTKTFESFDTFQPQSDYSQTFRVPASNKNYKVFKTAFDVNGIDYDVTKTLNATILFNGDEFIKGELRLNKIFNDLNKTDYELFFLGQSKNFVTALGQKKLNELNLVELRHQLSMSNVTKSWEAYPSTRDRVGQPILPSINNGLVLPNVPPGTIVYPLVDFGNTYDADELVQQVSISKGNSLHITNSTLNSAQRIWADRFKPMVKVKYIFDKIFEEAGFTYDSPFLDATGSPFFRLYLTAWGNDDSIYLKTLSDSFKGSITNTTSLLIEGAQAPFVYSNLDFINIEYDYGNNWSSTIKRYTVPANLTQTSVPISVSILGEKPNNSPLVLEVTKNNNIVVDSQEYNLGTIVNYSYSGNATVAPGDTLSVRARTTANNPDEFYLKIIFAEFNVEPESEVSISALLEEKYTQLDFIKDVLTMYKLVMVPDDEDSKKFTIVPWSNYVGSGAVRDWTKKIDLSKTIELEPLFLQQTEKLIFKHEEDTDWLNDLNKKTFKESFGELEVDAKNNLLSGEKVIQLKHAPTPVTELQGSNPSSYFNTIIPHIYSLEPGQTRLLKKPIKPRSRFLYYSGLMRNNTFTTERIYWVSDEGSLAQLAFFPMAGPYQYMRGDYFNPTVTENTLSESLTFDNEVGYLRFSTLNPQYTLYNKYWSDYINLLYNKDSRRLKATFVLDSQDLFNFKFSDVIFVKDTYFFVEKIEGIKLGEKNKCKVSLIKLIDYVPDPENFVSPYDYLEWQEVDVNWEDLDSVWEQV